MKAVNLPFVFILYFIKIKTTVNAAININNSPMKTELIEMIVILLMPCPGVKIFINPVNRKQH